MSVPRDPLPKFIQVGPFKASVYHREQKNILREAAADCRNCLQKGQHKTADCPNPVKCRQCLTDGHRASDLTSCSLIPEANNDNDVDDSSAFFTPTKNPPNQTDKRQANKQNNTLITDYTTKRRKKRGAASDSQEAAAHDAKTASTPPVTTRSNAAGHPQVTLPRQTDEHVSKRWPSRRADR